MQMVKVLCELGAIPAVLEIDSMVVKDTHASLWSPENTGMLRLLLDYGAAPECLILDGPRGYPLVKAASEGSVEAVSLLLALGANVNSSIPRRWGTALQASVAGGHIQVVRALLKAEADVNMIDMVVNNDNRFTFLYGPCDAQQTPIQLAAKTNNTEMVLLLLRSGALVNLCPILPVVHVAWIDTLFSRYEVDRSSEGTLPLAFAIQYAAQNENVPLVHQLLAAGAMVDSRIGIDYGSMPLQIAARLGNMELISLFLAYDADVNAPPEKYNGRTAIQAAAENGNIEVIQMLLDSHANVHALPGRRRGRTALQAALEKGNINAARHLLLSGADINSKPASSYGLTALQAAVSFGDIEIVTELLSYGADANAEAGPKWGLTALQAAVRKRSIDLLGLLLGAGADVNALSSNFGNMTALQFAVSIDWLEGVKLLLNYKPDVRMIPPFYQENYKAFSALGWAIQNFNLDMIALLFDHGAGPNDPVSISPDEPPTAFLYALSHSKRLYLPEIIELFVKNGADICQCWGSKSSLEVVIAVSPANVEVIRIIMELISQTTGNHYYGRIEKSLTWVKSWDTADIELLHLLLDAGADINAKNPDTETTALQHVAGNDSAEKVEFLLRNGAEVNIPATKEIGTPLQEAIIHQKLEIAELLLEHGADVNALPAEEYGVTALQAAAIHGYIPLALKLLERGADVTAAPSPIGGRTAIDGAAEHGHLDMLQLLLNAYGDREGLASLLDLPLFRHWHEFGHIHDLDPNNHGLAGIPHWPDYSGSPEKVVFRVKDSVVEDDDWKLELGVLPKCGGKHIVTALTRPDSNPILPSGVTVIKVDYNNHDSLVNALKDQDVLIITLNITAPPEIQHNLIDAAAAAGVAWILPNEFGGDPFDVAKGERHHSRCWQSSISRTHRKAWLQLRWSCMRVLAVAALLSLPISPYAHQDDKSAASLADFQNGTVYISSFTLSQQDILQSVLRVTGTNLEDWKLPHTTAKDRWKSGQDMFKAGNMVGLVRLSYSRAFFPDDPEIFEMSTGRSSSNTGGGLDNEVLGLSQENLDEFTKIGIDTKLTYVK
uniref:Putative ankyrin repeat protein n=1 Tax=Talaromyces marneffei PM1 TaxID=1077442 RepID=A0A093V951_TALMA